MAKTKKPAAKKTIIDVSHPGESAPPANSKSVIVSNRPILKDPMMVDDTISQDDKPDSSLAATSNKSSAKPLTAPLLTSVKPAKTEPEPDKAETVPPAPAPEPEAPAEAAKPVETEETDKPEEQDKPEETPKPPEVAVKDDDKVVAKPEEPKPDEPQPEASDAKETAPQPKDKTTPESPEIKQEAQRQAAIDKLTENKKYYLPINTVEKRRSRRFVGLGILLSLLLALAWADVALDAGLIHLNGVKPVTHFFSN